MRAKYEELKILIHEFAPICISVQETMLGNVKAPCPREYKCFHSEVNPDMGAHGGCMIYVRIDTPHHPFPLQTPLQATAVQIYLEKKYTICSIYLSPSYNFCTNDFTNLLQQLPRPFLLLGDLNGRHSLWGDVICDKRGNHCF